MKSCHYFWGLVLLPAHSCLILHSPLLPFQRKRPRKWSRLKLSLQREILARQMLVLGQKGAGSMGSFWKRIWLCLQAACAKWFNLIGKWHCKMAATLPEEELLCSQNNKFVTALDVQHVLTSLRCGCFLLQGQRDLLSALGSSVAPGLPTTASHPVHVWGDWEWGIISMHWTVVLCPQ